MVSEKLSKLGEVSWYSLTKIQEYYHTGHLFAWHLHLESKFIEGKDFLSTLGTPLKYTNSQIDLYELNNLLEDIDDKIKKTADDGLLIYFAGLLFIVIRNASHIISACTLERPIFNRYVPFLLEDKFKPKISPDNYEILLRARHASTRGAAAPELDGKWLQKESSEVRRWMKQIREVI